jgi:hypothetical protein
LDIVEQAKKIVDEARKSDVILRAVGGTAIGMRCLSAKHRSLTREYADIDLVGLRKQDKNIKKVLTEMGFEPNKRFNALHGVKRLQFWDMKKKIDIDIFLDVFEMCHKLTLKDRLKLDDYTIPLADLLMSKLQIVELNDKDVKDIICIVTDHDFGNESKEQIDIDYIAKLCSEDWGLWKTLSMNAKKIVEIIDSFDLQPGEKKMVASRLKNFIKRLEEEPKSFRWRMRSKLGESSKWYETVEEVKR